MSDLDEACEEIIRLEKLNDKLVLQNNVQHRLLEDALYFLYPVKQHCNCAHLYGSPCYSCKKKDLVKRITEVLR